MYTLPFLFLVPSFIQTYSPVLSRHIAAVLSVVYRSVVYSEPIEVNEYGIDCLLVFIIYLIMQTIWFAWLIFLMLIKLRMFFLNK